MKRLLMTAQLLSLTACGAPGSGFENPFTVPITLQLTPSQVSLTPGASNHVSVTAKSGDQLLGAPKVEAFGNSQITAVPDDSGFTVTASAQAAPGTYAFNVTGTYASGKGSAPFTVTIAAPETKPDTAALAFTPGALTLSQGQSMATALTLRQDGNVLDLPAVSLTVPSGITAVQNGTTVTVSAGASAVPGSYIIVASTALNGKTYQATLPVTVTKAEAPK